MKIPKEVKVALLILSAVAMAVFGIGYLRGSSLLDDMHMYHAVYEDVNGLAVGNVVKYKGMQVGQVRSVDFTERGNIHVSFNIGSDIPIPKNSRAAISESDILGGRSIEVQPSEVSARAEPGDTLRSTLKQGMMANVQQNVLMPLKSQLTVTLARLDTIMAGVQQTVQDSSTRANRVMRKAEQITGTMAQELPKSFAEINRSLANVNAILDSIRSNKELGKTMTNLRKASDSLKTTTSRLNTLLSTSDRTMTRMDSILTKVNNGTGTAGKVVNDPELYDNLTATSENLNRLLVDFQNNPKRYVHFSLFGGGKDKKDKDEE